MDKKKDQLSMKVKKRNGNTEEVSFDKVLHRLKQLANKSPPLSQINIYNIAQKVCTRIYDGVETSALDELASHICASMIATHPEYGTLASRIIISNHQKNTSPSFSETIFLLYNHKTNDVKSPLVSKELYDIVMKNKNKLNDVIDYSRDYNYDYFGFKTLERAYLMSINDRVVERPQHMLMRVSLGIHGEDFKDALNTYNFMSNHAFIHATPTLFNSGTPRPQLSSCFLLAMKADSIDGIFSTIKDCANISKWAGGIGLHIHNIRAKNSPIRGTNGISNGIVPMLRVFNNTARYVDQGGGKRNGSFAIYLEPWHGDIESFIELRKNHGNDEDRARDLFLGLWIPDLFMERVSKNEDWTLMCPDKCPGLSETYGDEFNDLYKKYESENMGIKKMRARDLWFQIITAQIETGTPYILFKDSCNRKSNQKNLGTIKSSNLCTEIIEYSDPGETAVCNLASINLKNLIVHDEIDDEFTIYTKTDCKYCKWAKQYLKSKKICFEEITIDANKDENQDNKNKMIELMNTLNISTENITLPQIFSNCGKDTTKYIGGFNELFCYKRGTIDYDKLVSISRTITKNLNKVIDRNFYPTDETVTSNKKHRPIGIGVQGLADLFCLLKIPFDSEEAKEINNKIFETIYFGAMTESMEISKKRSELMERIKVLRKSKKNKTIQNNEKKELRLLEKSLKPLDEELNRDKYLGSYSSFIGSPLSEGKFQFDLWQYDGIMNYDWSQLREDVMKYGVRNSLLLAPMPTASTSQILGNNECFEPFTSNIYIRRTLAGEFIKINSYLLEDLIGLNIWNNETKNKMLVNNGKINHLEEVPSIIKSIYKTSWELSQKTIIDLAIDRAKWICQSQSMNIFLEEPDFEKITSMHFYSWKKGLKTGMYYLRTQPKVKAQQFTVTPENPCESCSA